MILTEKWDKFRLNIKSQLNSLDQEVIENKVYITEYSQEDIDRYWDKLNSFIVSTADSELPRKVIRLHNTFIRYNKKKTRPEHRNTPANIVIDKVLVNEESEGLTKRLATELEEVKEAVDNDFASMFRKRNTLQNSLTPLWQQIYKPAGKFKEVMEATIEKVIMEEWNNTVKELNKNSTAGLSGINYKIILQLPEELVILLVKFENLTLQTRLVPKAWKTSIILLILKPTNFEYNILNT
ncbi:hypothetical protein RhiirA5_439331 [Rhizophagus irregularis]|uniref:Uncharacterized protein n=1 Tax=Rhizophagus irregularis TaxID=588596 RepID=A0A2N0NI13_9GLOM|nr:hypothetical protein RhiirA5_439331 [Rhizophagus irregularis]